MRPAAPPPQKMAERIADQLRAQIIRRDLVDGQFLPFEAELCAHFGTSRPTMREAIRILETEGLLSIRRGGRHGAQVRAPHPTVLARSLGLLLQFRGVELEAVYDAFLAIVPASARELAEHPTTETLAALRAQRERCRETAGDSAAFLDESTSFLLLLVARADNPVQDLLAQILAEVLRSHRAAMSAYFEAKPRVRTRRATEVLESTATIIAMIEAGDTGVDDYLRTRFQAHIHKALQVPMVGAVQIV